MKGREFILTHVSRGFCQWLTLSAVIKQRQRARRMWQGRDGVGGGRGMAEMAWEKAMARQRQHGRRPWQGRDSVGGGHGMAEMAWEKAVAEKSCLPHGIQEASKS